MSEQPDGMVRIDQALYANRMIEGLQEQLTAALERGARFAALSDMLGKLLSDTRAELARQQEGSTRSDAE